MTMLDDEERKRWEESTKCDNTTGKVDKKNRTQQWDFFGMNKCQATASPTHRYLQLWAA